MITPTVAEPTMSPGTAVEPDDCIESDRLLQPIMVRLQSCQRGALSELYELTAPTLFSFAIEALNDSAQAAEVLADVYVQAFQTAAQYRESDHTVTAWLLLICRSQLIARYNREDLGARNAPVRQRDGTQLATTDADLPLSGTDRNLSRKSGGFAGLPPLQAHFMSAALFRGLGYREIAAETELAVGTVKTHLRLALATLRAQWQDESSRHVSRRRSS